MFHRVLAQDFVQICTQNETSLAKVKDELQLTQKQLEYSLAEKKQLEDRLLSTNEYVKEIEKQLECSLVEKKQLEDEFKKAIIEKELSHLKMQKLCQNWKLINNSLRGFDTLVDQKISQNIVPISSNSSKDENTSYCPDPRVSFREPALETSPDDGDHNCTFPMEKENVMQFSDVESCNVSSNHLSNENSSKAVTTINESEVIIFKHPMKQRESFDAAISQPVEEEIQWVRRGDLPTDANENSRDSSPSNPTRGDESNNEMAITRNLIRDIFDSSCESSEAEVSPHVNCATKEPNYICLGNRSNTRMSFASDCKLTVNLRRISNLGSEVFQESPKEKTSNSERETKTNNRLEELPKHQKFLKCLLCKDGQAVFKSHCSLDKHLNTHDNLHPFYFRCHYQQGTCKRHLRSNKKLLKHVKKHHAGEDLSITNDKLISGQSRLQCSVASCRKVFANEEHLDSHRSKVHHLAKIHPTDKRGKYSKENTKSSNPISDLFEAS